MIDRRTWNVLTIPKFWLIPYIPLPVRSMFPLPTGQPRHYLNHEQILVA